MVRSGSTYSIGEAVSRLQGQYPDLTVSKVRFLEDKGLVTPERTPGGYRKFNEADLKRLEAILMMQNLYFYPLNVIKTKLEAEERGESLPELETLDADAAEDATQLLSGQPQSLTAISEMLDVPASFIRDLAQYGVIAIDKGKGGSTVDGGSLGLIKACWALREQGIDPRHLRTFVNAADREATLLVQAVLPQLKAAALDSKRQGLDRLRELEELTSTVKRSLFQNALDRELDGLGEVQ